jgi:cytidylate kinase
MSIITISRRPFSRGKEVAEKVADNLHYDCVAREVLFEAAEKFGVREKEFMRAIHDAPSFSDHFHYGRERYVAFFQAVLLEVLQRDNIVYHGLAGHFFVRGVSHALKVRVITDLDERVRILTEREDIGPKAAARIIEREDRDRRRWSRHLYGIDTWDSGLYNMVLNISEISVDDAAEIICHAASLERFKATPESRRKFADLLTAALVKAALIQKRPDVEVSVEGGKLLVKTESMESEEAGLRGRIERIVKDIPGVDQVEIRIDHSVRHHD